MSNSSFGLILTRGALLSFFAMVLLCCLTSPASGKPLIIEKSVITSDTVWEGELLIKGDVEVVKGATLIIMPGTVVRFVKVEPYGPTKLYKDKEVYFPRSEIIVKGRIFAQGTKHKMIVFTSAEKSPRNSDWGAINFLDSEDNILEFCELSYGHTSVHAHGAQVVVTNCYFHDNGVAFGMKNVKGASIKSKVPILYNRITGNGGGILFGGGASPTIAHNQIDNNVFFGIFVKKGAPNYIRYNNITQNGKGVITYSVEDLRLRENNIFDNKEYNISLMEGQTQDVDARHNWWGTTDEKRIKALIWDRDEDESLGTLDFSHFADSPIEGAGVPR